MATLKFYAGATRNGMVKLPSPTALKLGDELIWSENTGRAQSGPNQAKMIGDVIAQKDTFDVEWAVLMPEDMALIKTVFVPRPSFFFFGFGTSQQEAVANAVTVYRSTISATLAPGLTAYYKDVTIPMVEQ